MANIEISKLEPAGSQLFEDSESYLNELTEFQMMGVAGGAGARTFTQVIIKDVSSVGDVSFNGPIITNTANTNTFGNNNSNIGK
jgi:hypothetical protein